MESSLANSNVGDAANPRPRVSTQMFSLDFSDTMRPHGLEEASERGNSQNGLGPNTEAMEAIAAALQLFDLCRPAEDTTIAAVDLAKVLRSHLGGDSEVGRILGLMGGGSNPQPTDRFNFLTYWQGMDRFLNEAGAFNQTGKVEHVGEFDTIRGMQRFRDGVLDLARASGLAKDGAISSLDLLDLLKSIRTRASDPSYWDEVMQAVPAEEGFGLTMPEVAEAVYIWLKDYLKAEMEAVDGDAAIPAAPVQPIHEQNGTSSSSLTRLVSMDNMSMQAAKTEGPPSRMQSTSETETDGPPLGVRRQRAQTEIAGRCREESDDMQDSMFGHSQSMSRASSDVQRARELLDLILQRTPQENTMVHGALSRLSTLHDSIFSALLNRQQEVISLRMEVGTISEKRDQMEEDMARSVEHAQELDERFAEVEREHDECAQKVKGLEKQVRDLNVQCSDLQDQLSKAHTQAENHEQERVMRSRDTVVHKDRMAQLLQDADNAEGRAQWMRSKLERLQKRFVTSTRAARSYAQCAEEGEESASLLQQQLLSGKSFSRGGQDAEQQLQLQQAQLHRLRQVRDDLLKSHDSWAAKPPDEGSCSPRELQVQRRCTFLGSQLQSLLEHARSLEILLDDNSGSDADAKRAMSIERIAEDAKKKFGEFSEKLHTLEVQKADVDQELRRLQQRCAEQENQFQVVQRHRDQLLLEVGTSTKSTEKHKVHSDDSSSFSSPSKHDTTGFLFDGARPAKDELRCSPKVPQAAEKLRRGVRTMVHLQHLAGRSLSPERQKPDPNNFHMSARGSTQDIESGQWRRDQGHRERSEHRNRDRSEHRQHEKSRHRSSHSKGARRDHKEKDSRHNKGEDEKDKSRSHKTRARRADGNCETQ